MCLLNRMSDKSNHLIGYNKLRAVSATKTFSKLKWLEINLKMLKTPIWKTRNGIPSSNINIVSHYMIHPTSIPKIICWAWVITKILIIFCKMSKIKSKWVQMWTEKKIRRADYWGRDAIDRAGNRFINTKHKKERINSENFYNI